MENTSIRDLIGYVKALTVGTVMPMIILLFVYRFESFSRAVFVIYWGLMMIMLSLSRLSFRLLEEGITKGSRKGRPTLIYGAGFGGQLAVKEIETNRDLGLGLVGFMDDNPAIRRRKVRGYPVFGGQEDLEKTIRKYAIKEVVVSFRENGMEKKKEIRRLCQAMGAEVDVRQMRMVID